MFFTKTNHPAEGNTKTLYTKNENSVIILKRYDKNFTFLCRIFLFHDSKAPPLPQWARASSLSNTPRHTTIRTPLYERSARRKDLYLTTHNTPSVPTGGIRTRNPRKRAAADPRLRPPSYRLSRNNVKLNKGQYRDSPKNVYTLYIDIYVLCVYIFGTTCIN